jgi:hypothetical protein
MKRYKIFINKVSLSLAHTPKTQSTLVFLQYLNVPEIVICKYLCKTCPTYPIIQRLEIHIKRVQQIWLPFLTLSIVSPMT